MKSRVYSLSAVMVLLIGLLLLWLTNIGFITLRQPYVVKQGANLYPGSGPLAFVNVNVLPMDEERLLVDHTVIVRDGRIEKVGPSSQVSLPPDVQVISGEGAYLMPGLVDMHVHIKEENEMLLFVAHGVTAVRDLWGTTGIQLKMGFPNQLEMRRKTVSGELMGPTIYTSGPIMEGKPATSPIMPVILTAEDAVESVLWQKAEGYDFVKVYDRLTPSVYEAIVRTADQQDLPVVGHSPHQVGLARTLASGQSTIEHLTGFIDPDKADFAIPEDKIAEFAMLAREAGVWNCPTIGVYQKYVPDDKLYLLEEQPGMELISPRMKILWKYMLRPGAMQNVSFEGDFPAQISEIYLRVTRILHENGAGIILGTDSDNPYLVPGLSLWDELDYLVEAGLTPYEALLAGTRNPAESLDRLDEFGTVVEGARADLILLNENPMESVTAVRNPIGVTLRGEWLPKDKLDGMLAELMDSYPPTWGERMLPLAIAALGLLIWLRKRASNLGERDA